MALSVLASACNLTTPTRYIGDGAVAADCPKVYTSTGAAVVDEACFLGRCTVEVAQAGCELKMSWGTGCTMLPSHGTVGKDGVVTFAEDTPAGACEGHANAAVDRRTPAFTMDCTPSGKSCRIDLYVPPFPPVGTSTAIQVVAGMPYDAPVKFDRLSSIYPTLGYIATSVLLGDQLVLVAYSAGLDSFFCQTKDPSPVLYLDTRTMMITGRATTVTCLVRSMADPASGGFFGAYRTERAPMIGLFDARAQLVRSASVTVGMDPMNNAGATAMARSEDGQRLYVIYTVEGSGRVAVIDPISLATLSVTHTQHQLRSAALLDDMHLAVSSADSDDVLYFDASTGRLSGGVIVTHAALFPATAGFLLRHRESSSLVVSVTGSAGSIQVVGRVVESDAQYYENKAVPWATHTWPKDRRLLAVGLMTNDDAEISELALYDPAAGRFLPGTARLPGTGMVGDIHEDARGNLWIVLPWSGRVVRLTPPP